MADTFQDAGQVAQLKSKLIAGELGETQVHDDVEENERADRQQVGIGQEKPESRERIPPERLLARQVRLHVFGAEFANAKIFQRPDDHDRDEQHGG